MRRETEFFMFTNFQAAKTQCRAPCSPVYNSSNNKNTNVLPFLWHSPVLLRELMVHSFDGVAPYIRYRIGGGGLVTPPGQMNST